MFVSITGNVVPTAACIVVQFNFDYQLQMRKWLDYFRYAFLYDYFRYTFLYDYFRYAFLVSCEPKYELTRRGYFEIVGFHPSDSSANVDKDDQMSFCVGHKNFDHKIIWLARLALFAFCYKQNPRGNEIFPEDQQIRA